MERPYGISTSRSRRHGTGNLAPTWWRGPVGFLAQTENKAKAEGKRGGIPDGLAPVSTAGLRSIAVETGNTRFAKPRFGHSPT